VEARPGLASAVTDALTVDGARLLRTADDLVEAQVPVHALDDVAALPQVAYVRQPFRPFPDGAPSSELYWPRLRAWQFEGWSGAGVKLAVIDIGFYGLVSAQNQGLLPNDVVTVNDCSSGFSNSDHGTNVAEIAHAAAPGAHLYLICVDSEVGLAEA